jgi:lipopolysaccharide transport system ATP-binding protein
MSSVVIRGAKLGKRYRIGERQRYRALRDVLTDALKAPARLLRPAAASNHAPRHIWALKDVSFDVHQGGLVGIIGRNGAGKTTLLKILARVTRPTEGFAEVRGRMGSLLEVGTGFHPELTGRENTFLSGAILGMRKKEIERKFDEIIAFAEVEQFIDTPLKHFSTGMQMRLAFAVAAHLDPEILLVDEVLAVGDLAFQKKCLGKMSDVTRTGRTIIFVSHQMNQIRRLCKDCLWLDQGRVRQAGAMLDVVSAYEASLSSISADAGRDASNAHDPARFLRWRILDSRDAEPHLLATFGKVTVQFVVRVNRPIEKGIHGVALFNADNHIIWATSVSGLHLLPGSHAFEFELPSLPLRPGVYRWQVSLWEGGDCLDQWSCVPEMIVGTEPITHPQDEWQGLLNLPWEFRLEKCQDAAEQAARPAVTSKTD